MSLRDRAALGKSSLLNAIEPGLGLRVSHVSEENQKGRHTTTTAQLIPMEQGGYLIDTPAIRQFQLWDVIPEEVSGFFADLRPFVNRCRFPNCTHTHEDACGVKWAVADGYRRRPPLRELLPNDRGFLEWRLTWSRSGVPGDIGLLAPMDQDPFRAAVRDIQPPLRVLRNSVVRPRAIGKFRRRGAIRRNGCWISCGSTLQ